MSFAEGRPTDEQLAGWLYDAEYDWNTDDYDAPMPSNDFPKYYDDDYQSTLALIFRELIESRARNASGS